MKQYVKCLDNNNSCLILNNEYEFLREIKAGDNCSMYVIIVNDVPIEFYSVIFTKPYTKKLVETFFRNGNISIRANYKDDKLYGLYESFLLNGNIWYRINYKDGKRDGLYESFNPDKTLNLWKYYKDGIDISDKYIRLENGKIISKKEFENKQKEEIMQPTKEQIIEASKTSKEAKECLEKLFPDYFPKDLSVTIEFNCNTNAPLYVEKNSNGSIVEVLLWSSGNRKSFQLSKCYNWEIKNNCLIPTKKI